MNEFALMSAQSQGAASALVVSRGTASVNMHTHPRVILMGSPIDVDTRTGGSMLALAARAMSWSPKSSIGTTSNSIRPAVTNHEGTVNATASIAFGLCD